MGCANFTVTHIRFDGEKCILLLFIIHYSLTADKINWIFETKASSSFRQRWPCVCVCVLLSVCGGNKNVNQFFLFGDTIGLSHEALNVFNNLNIDKSHGPILDHTYYVQCTIMGRGHSHLPVHSNCIHTNASHRSDF